MSATESDYIVAIHESGHAVTDVFYGLTFEYVTLDHERGPHIEGEIYKRPTDRRSVTSAEIDWISRITKSTYAAQWAEREEFGQDHPAGVAGDNGNAAQFGVDYFLDPEARAAWLGKQFFAAKEDVKALMEPIRAVARELVSKRTLSYADVKAIYDKFEI